ncbi:hypothetical protein FAZ21_19785 [Chitiniphilus eburneus]|uniref:Uncharacterized protein n=2 Tax=Chitiniphilus eburneus TaxID=2571148 RepID=A0A4U0P5L6_9NEIS|nr:hypothetical protein FAZ21_19785 [Chitiniphilus eburneus]
MGYVTATFEDGFERPIENIMWQVVLLVLSGGWYPDKMKTARVNIASFIRANDLNDLLKDVPLDEANLFLHDLKILNLIDP